MAYVPDPTDVSRPVDADPAESAQAEFRALKAYIATLAGLGGGMNLFRKNRLINGNFAIKQRPLASAPDDSYGHDRWYILTSAAGNQTISTSVDSLDGVPTTSVLVLGAAGILGYAQIIEGKNCKDLRGTQLTLRFGNVKSSVACNMRYAVLEWQGTEDAVTSDVVNNWTSAVYTPNNFFINTVVVAGTGSQPLLANTNTTGASLTVTLSSLFNNLIIMAWREDSGLLGDSIRLANAQAEGAGAASPFEVPSYTQNLIECRRYLPGYIPTTAASSPICSGFAISGTSGLYNFPFSGEPRVPPTGLDTAVTSADFRVTDGAGSNVAVNAGPTFVRGSLKSVDISAGVAAGLTLGQGSMLGSLATTALLLFGGCEL